MIVTEFFGAFVIKHFYDNNMENEAWDNNVKSYCCSYSKQFNLAWFKQKTEEFIDEYQENIQVFMIDYAIQPNQDMIKYYNWLKMRNIEFHWIDHHETAIENIGADTIPGYIHDKTCAAVNTWAYVNELQQKLLGQCPKILTMVNDLDIWNRAGTKYSWEDEILPLNYYITSLGTDLNDNKGELVQFLKNAFSDDAVLDKLILIGKYISNYVKAQERQNLKRIYPMEWNGYNCLVLNSTIPGSTQFENYEGFEDADLLITWSFDGKNYFYGVYSSNPNIDVGELCQSQLHGGGHRSAGGGMTKEYIFS